MGSLKPVTWQTIRKKVRATNTALCKIIDNIDPSSNFKLYLGTYNYGEHIIKNGSFIVPNTNNNLEPLNSSNLPNELKQELGYNYFTNPVSLILKNTLEIFYIFNDCTIPLYGLVPPGSMISTWKVISDFESHGPAFLWDVTAGARSLFQLSKISDTAGNKRLKKHFNLITSSQPKTFLTQWEIFRLLTSQMEKPWETEILFFGKKWFEKINDPSFRELQIYLLKQAWEGSNYFRHQFIWDLIYSVIQERRKIKVEPYIIDTVKHLIAISIGVAPGFSPAINDYAGPVQFLKQVYTEVYQLKNYEPIFMHPHNINPCDNRSVYYSLDYPTSLNFSVRPNEEHSKIQDLINIKSVMNKFIDEINQGNLNIDQTPISDMAKNIEFDYYHAIEGFHQISNITQLIQQDDSILDLVGGNMKKFPRHSSFLKGCIKIKSSSKNK